ncbi:MAG: hypothetical protein KME26_24950 [Oscillatoria princeps RMCB-10]|jgi:hypothetical protein|nr:hypothetical protein [Oscillatoria princeps RMCB-10]
MSSQREHPVFETTLGRAKHEDYQLLVLTERLFALMLRPYIIGMLTIPTTFTPDLSLLTFHSALF